MSGHQEPESLAVYSLYDCLYSQDAQAGGRLCGVRATAVSKRFLTMCCKEVTTVSTPDKSVSYNELELSKEEMGSHVVPQLERRVSDPRVFPNVYLSVCKTARYSTLKQNSTK